MKEPSPHLETGARARITFSGRSTEAVVVLASPNGRALFFSFDAVLGGYVGEMAVLWKDGAFYDLVSPQIVIVERAAE